MNLDNEKLLKKDCPYFESNCPGGQESSEQLLDCKCSKYLAYVDAKDTSIVNQELKNMNITATKKMEILLSMQKIFAERFHKIEGLTKDEIDHWTNEYLVCIEDEIIEAEEFLDIYLTTIKEFNLVEFRKELIDILHFLMDGMLVTGMKYNELVDVYGKECNKDLNDIDVLDYAMSREQIYIEQISEQNQYLYILNYLLRDIRLVRQCISWKHWKKPNSEINKEKIYIAYMNMFRHLIQLFIATDMSSEDVYNVYVQKNIENILRQKYSY